MDAEAIDSLIAECPEWGPGGDSPDLRREVSFSERMRDDLETVLAWQQGGEVSPAELERAPGGTVGTASLFPKVSAYESIKTVGLDLTSDSELRDAVTSLHELTLARVEFFQGGRIRLQAEVVMPFLRRSLEYAGDGGIVKTERQTGMQGVAPLDVLRPVDVAALRGSAEYRIMLRERFNVETLLLQSYMSL